MTNQEIALSVAKKALYQAMEENPKHLQGLTDRQLKILAQERYPIENPNCQTEVFFKRKMRDEYFDKLKKLRDDV